MKKKIFVIDDEESIRKFLTRILDKSGYEVVTASDGREALEIVDYDTVDLIMLDMNMPKMNGIEFLRKLGTMNVKKIPVLMVSGETDLDVMVECYKLGVYDFIKKPEQVEVMLKRVENGLKIGEMIHFNEFIKIELNMARKFQKYLYPDPEFSTDRLGIRIWSKLLSDIGGDLYDYLVLEGGRLAFFVADVSGHSISAALYTAIVKMIFRNSIHRTSDPGGLLTLVNKDLFGNIPVESFVTMFCGVLDPESGVLNYANAGHPEPYVLSANGSDVLQGNGSFLGPIKDATYETFSKNLDPHDCLIVFTDGVLDVFSESMKVGNRLLQECLNIPASTCDERFELLKNRLLSENINIHDDCTLMMIKLK
ncbi:MAG: SpoIIE family protein phosphatase [Spirochaetes bacterium]|jgi:sigma-B regulation protein RsbU (phosphoserine phosphatase)|nr:SpoIIE family protein phosphatase [Spirochaetota bacterium]